MIIYLGLLFAPAAWQLSRGVHGGGVAGRWTAWAILILLTLFVGLRREVGGDWSAYLTMLSIAETNAWPVAAGLGDPGYMLLNSLAAGLGFGMAGVNLVCAASFCSGLIAFASRQARPALALLIATPVLILVVALGFTRQSVAVGLAMAGLALAMGDARRSSLALFAIAPLFHWSAVILWPLAFALAWPNLLSRKNAWAGAAAILTVAAIAAVTTPLLQSLSILHSQPSAGALFRLAPSVLGVACFWWLQQRGAFDRKQMTIAGYLAGLTIIVAPLTLGAPALADRIGFYTVLLQMIVFPRLVAEVPAGWIRMISTAAVAGLYCILMAGWLAWTPYRPCWAPYRTYLTEPRMIGAGPAYLHIRRSQECEFNKVTRRRAAFLKEASR